MVVAAGHCDDTAEVQDTEVYKYLMPKTRVKIRVRATEYNCV